MNFILQIDLDFRKKGRLILEINGYYQADILGYEYDLGRTYYSVDEKISVIDTYTNDINYGLIGAKIDYKINNFIFGLNYNGKFSKNLIDNSALINLGFQF